MLLRLTPDLYELVLLSVSPSERLTAWFAIDQCSIGLRIFPFRVWRTEILRALTSIDPTLQWEKLLMLVNHDGDRVRWKRVGMRIHAQPTDQTLAKLASYCLTDDLSALIMMLHTFPRAVTCKQFPPTSGANSYNYSYLFCIDDGRYGINIVEPMHLPPSITPHTYAGYNSDPVRSIDIIEFVKLVLRGNPYFKPQILGTRSVPRCPLLGAHMHACGAIHVAADAVSRKRLLE